MISKRLAATMRERVSNPPRSLGAGSMTPSTLQGRTGTISRSARRMPEEDQSKSPSRTSAALMPRPGGWASASVLAKQLTAWGSAQGPKGDATAKIGGDRQHEGEPIAAGEVEDPARCP